MEASEQSFPVIGIGASAGDSKPSPIALRYQIHRRAGVSARKHLDPHHPSLLVDIIATKTEIPVQTAVDGQPVKPECLYVIPPNATMKLENGTLRLASRQAGVHKPVNLLIRSLAQEYMHRAVGVVLSGTDADGAEGWKKSRRSAASRWRRSPIPRNSPGCLKVPSPPDALTSCCRPGSWPRSYCGWHGIHI